MPLDIHPLAGLIDDQTHMLDQESGDPLPVGRRGRGRPPDRWQIGSQATDRKLVLGREPVRGRPLPSLVLLLDLPPRFQRLLPASFQLAADETVFRLASLILT